MKTQIKKITIFNAKTQCFSNGNMAVPSELKLSVCVATCSAFSCRKISFSGHIHKCV